MDGGKTMPKRDVIAVVGATGAQGGGLARAILNDAGSRFAVRALTRNVSSPAARELAKQGAEVVAADVDDPESLKRAFDRAYGAFCVTFFWAHFSPEMEMAEAAAMAHAARGAGLRHVIWSSLEDTRKLVPLSDPRMPTLMGKYKVPHFDAKGASDGVFRATGLPTTILLTSFYWDNFIHFGMGPKRGADGRLAITLPMGAAKLPGIAGEFLTGAQMAAALTEALGQPVRYNDVPPEVFRAFGFPGAEDLGNMFQFKRDFEAQFCGARDLQLARQLNPALQTFAAWLSANKDQIPVEAAAAAAC
jgi:uncharacterized protein YbjT (DUF2867 family)